ncbi:hypothetical protein [Anaeromassilibacillus senegalensis]|uniref:ATP-grasp domain-containing protein n=1 Tax=Anaeromassilibacillus senegalensis TaxID=1673717 RepID=A0ABS9CLF6_9FIRM|nr:hypothetical protein [Anaeromassilibacillus senegalensis]MCF2651181.1 ATP-grasp domain-containing protein [Anaeromassilibacillus senegalensis]
MLCYTMLLLWKLADRWAADALFCALRRLCTMLQTIVLLDNLLLIAAFCEFLRGTDGVYRLLECNPRFSGGAEFTVLAGYDCMHSHMQCFMGEEIDPKPTIRPVYLARRYEAYITEAVRQQEEVPR